MSDFKNIPTQASDAWLDNVPSASNLPITNNQIGDKRQALDTQAIYSWNGTGWTLIASPAAATAVTALIGDVSATGPGAAVTTLKTVNLNVGEFGDAANSATVTVNEKGLVTGASETPIQIAQTQVDGLTTSLSGKQNTITGGASTVTTSNLTVSRALVSNGSGKIAVSNATQTEVGYLSGVTSAIQTQLNGKQATITGGASTVTTSNLTTNRALISDGSGKIAVSSITSTELGYLQNAYAPLQNQIDTITDNLNLKQDVITGAASTITFTTLPPNIAVLSDGDGNINTATGFPIENLNTLSDIDTSTTVQEQLNSKVGIRRFHHYPMYLNWTGSFYTIQAPAALNRQASGRIDYYCQRKTYFYDANTMEFFFELPAQPDFTTWDSEVTNNFSSLFLGSPQQVYAVFEDEIDPSIPVPARVSWYNISIVEMMALPFRYGFYGSLGSLGYFISDYTGWKGVAMPPKSSLTNPSAPNIMQSIWDQLGGGNNADFINNELGQAVWKRVYPYSSKRKLTWLPKVGLVKEYGSSRDRLVIDSTGALVNWSSNQFTVLANGFFDLSGQLVKRPKPMAGGQKLVFACLLENSSGERALELSGVQADRINVANFDTTNYDIEMVVEEPNGYVEVYPMPYYVTGDSNIYQAIIDLNTSGINRPYIYPPKTKFFFRLKHKTTNRVSNMFPMYGEVRKALLWDIVIWQGFVPK